MRRTGVANISEGACIRAYSTACRRQRFHIRPCLCRRLGRAKALRYFGKGVAFRQALGREKGINGKNVGTPTKSGFLLFLLLEKRVSFFRPPGNGSWWDK
jgi:hypothetical protein